DPLGHTGIRIAREDGHRPFVVARPLLRIPRRGIARTVVDEVELGVIGNPAPCATAADLPLIALPGLDAGILADRLANLGGFLGVDQDVIVRALRVSLPSLLATL